MINKLKRPAAFLSAFVMVMALLMYFQNGMFSTCFGLKASAEGITMTEPPKDGNGVYQIGTAGELYWFADKVNNENSTYGSANAVLTADITVNRNLLDSLTVDSEGNVSNGTDFTSWTPIGWYDYVTDVFYSYVGTFDGQNHTVSGLYFNDSNTSYVGLFGYMEKSNVSNVGIIDSYLSGNNNVGGVCGCKNLGTIKNCYNTGIVSGRDCIGGVCGYKIFGTITNCYNTGKVRGDGSVGGVCGTNDGTITNCYNTGKVSGFNGVGGVCGKNDGTITECYNTGNINGSYYVGGVCGLNYYGTIKSCYFNSDKYSGNAVGLNDGVTATATDAEGKTTAQFASGEVCVLVTYHSYQNGICIVCGCEAPVLNENGYYEISNANQLYWFAAFVNNGNTSANAVLTADIVVNTGVLKSDGTLADDTSGFRSWTPIGNKSNKYSGTFDGQNHTISGLYFNDSNTSGVGLFGYMEKSNVFEVGIVDSYFNGSESVGGVCGENCYGSIQDCYNKGTVSGSNDVGGVCGYKLFGKFTNCFNTGKVSGSESAGGVLGNNGDSTLENCYNTGNISGDTNVGGVCGFNGIFATIKNCINTGNIKGDREVTGGVCGYNYGTITNCYFNNHIYSGNAVGYDDGGTVTNVSGKTLLQFRNGEACEAVGYHSHQNGICVICECIENDIMIYGQSVTLDGTIGMNVYVIANDDYTDWTASFNGTEVEKPEKDANGRYKFTYQVAAKDMDNEIQFTVNDKIDVTVSVSEYLAELSKTDDESLKNLVNSMINYGSAAEAYFGSGTVAEQTVTDDLSVYDFEVGTMPEGISYYGSSLILESETTIRHYFTLADGQNIENFTFTVKVGNADYSTVTPVAKQDYYYIDIENISADKLDEKHTVKIGDSEVISGYSALSYAKTVLDNDTADDNLKNLVKALYLYNKNALAYNAA